ncbi:MAG: helix-turn-helix transcriptional regulator [Deltaproteobacteria bacterium]|nr:helix-turn-helix transcriptional regulator [Deltaproteobacteria bacterium]
MLIHYIDWTMLGRPAIKEAPIFGKKISELRKARGLTQVEFAEQLSLSQGTINDYERRTSNPSLNLVRRLAAFFEVPVAELLEQEEAVEQRPARTTQLERAFEAVKALPRSKQKVIVDIIESYARSNS